MITLTLDLAEFAAKRRKAQDDLVAALFPAVQASLKELESGSETWDDDLLAAVGRAYEASYRAEGGDGEPNTAAFLRSLTKALSKTKPESSADTIATWLAISVINAAAMQATNDDPEDLFIEWVTMHDKDVRTEHRLTEGQVRPAGEPFDVDGTPMIMPGDPSAPIELWINCRCTVRPVAASETLVAAAEGETMPEDERTQVGTAPNYMQVEEAGPVPWHGVLAPEGISSGDGRKFAEGSLSTRPLPLPLTWQKISDDGHKGNVTVAKIEKIEMREGLMRASGHFVNIPEADEVMGLLAEFGKFGVSVDADSTEFDMDEDAEEVVFTAARVSSACIVPIPAFAEAWVALGPWDDEDNTEPVQDPVPAEVSIQDEGLAASIQAMRDKVATFVDVAPGRTEDGPGWLTNPVDTDRLRDYWVRGPGAAKIGWGSAGDFNRCRIAVAQYVKPQHLNGYCANRHYDALGFWPGRPVAGETTPFAAEVLELEDTQPAEALSLVAAGGFCAPSEWFCDPELTEVTPLQVTKEGRVFGHIAHWDQCHLDGMLKGGVCTAPPHSMTNYAGFLNSGVVLLSDDTTVAVGQISIGGGHAAPRLGMRGALSHYDSTSTAAADVTIGEDEFGIWVAGWTRPGISDEMVTALRASAVSGDWRVLGGNLELIAVLAVNSPGFGIPRVRVAAAAQGQLSLVAAGFVAPSAETVAAASEVDIDVLAEKVAAAIIAVGQRRERIAAAVARLEG